LPVITWRLYNLVIKIAINMTFYLLYSVIIATMKNRVNRPEPITSSN
jgi:hypothetical protein